MKKKLKKPRRPPNLKNPNSKTWKKRADDEWKRQILCNAFGQKMHCEVCAQRGAANHEHQVHIHHLISRTNLRYRHDLMNGIRLCATHHNIGGWMIDICAEGDLNQVTNFETWLCAHKYKQWQWWMKAKEDKRQKTWSYQEAFERLVNG